MRGAVVLSALLLLVCLWTTASRREHSEVTLSHDPESVFSKPMRRETTKSRAPASEAEPLRTFGTLMEKGVRTAEERAKLQSLYENLNVHEEVRSFLIANDTSHFARAEEKRRFEAITFLESALRATHDEEKERVISVIEQIVLSPNLIATLPLAVKRSIAGDKLELFQMLRRCSETRAERLLAQVADPKVKALLSQAQ